MSRKPRVCDECIYDHIALMRRTETDSSASGGDEAFHWRYILAAFIDWKVCRTYELERSLTLHPADMDACGHICVARWSSCVFESLVLHRKHMNVIRSLRHHILPPVSLLLTLLDVMINHRS